MTAGRVSARSARCFMPRTVEDIGETVSNTAKQWPLNSTLRMHKRSQLVSHGRRPGPGSRSIVNHTKASRLGVHSSRLRRPQDAILPTSDRAVLAPRESQRRTHCPLADKPRIETIRPTNILAQSKSYCSAGLRRMVRNTTEWPWSGLHSTHPLTRTG